MNDREVRAAAAEANSKLEVETALKEAKEAFESSHDGFKGALAENQPLDQLCSDVLAQVVFVVEQVGVVSGTVVIESASPEPFRLLT